MTNDPIKEIKSWPYHLGLCSSWLEIIARELPLHGDELEAAEANRLAAEAEKIRARIRGAA